MKNAIRRTSIAMLVTAALIPAASARATEPVHPTVMTLRGFGTNFTGIGRGRSGDLEIAIERWSTAEERADLKKALAAKGGAGLVAALPAKPRVGYVRASKGGTVDVKFAAVADLPDGRRRVLLATGPVTAPADGSRPHAQTFEALIIEIRLEKDGTGEGRTGGPDKLELGAEGEVLELEAYGAAPVWISPLKVVSEAPAR